MEACIVRQCELFSLHFVYLPIAVALVERVEGVTVEFEAALLCWENEKAL